MGDSCRFSNTHGIVPLAVDGDITGSYDLDSIDMSLYNHVTILISCSADLAGNNVLKMHGGAADGIKTADTTFTYRYGGAAAKSASADVLTAPATSAALTLTAATYAGRVLVVEVDAEDMVVAGVQYRYLTGNFDGTATTGTASAFAVLSEPRYETSIMKTAIPTS